MLDNLLEIEIAYSLLKSDVGDGSKDPLDVHYENLKCHLEVRMEREKIHGWVHRWIKIKTLCVVFREIHVHFMVCV